MKTKIIAAASLAALLVAGTADASHNRGSVLVPSIDGQGNLTIDATSFWRPTFVDDVNIVRITSPGGSTFSLNMGSDTTNTSDSRFTRVDESASVNIMSRGAGTYTISWGDCCRVGGIPNGSNGNYGTTSTIYWDGKNATKPISFDIQNIQPNVVRGQAYSDNLDVTSNNGDMLSYDDSVLTVGIPFQAPGFTINAAGQIMVPGASTATYADNSSNDGADMAFSGQINASNGTRMTGSVQFDWLFDAVATGANSVPDVADVVINATVGDMISTSISGTDPNGDNVTLSLISFNGPGGAISGASFVPGAPGSPTSGAFSWDSTGFGVGTYIATILGTDGSLTDQGTIRINLAAPTNGGGGGGGGGTAPIPLPAGFGLLITALFGMGLFARRRS